MVSALDSKFNLGENGTVQHGHGGTFAERLVKLSFQLVRGTATGNAALRARYVGLIQSASSNAEYVQLIQLMLHTRDVENGKGERDLFYQMLLGWCEAAHVAETTGQGNLMMPRLAQKVVVGTLSHTVSHTALGGKPYGSWKDVKNFMLACTEDPILGDRNPAFLYAGRLMAEQLMMDDAEVDNSRLSLAGKWAPRPSKRKYGQFADVLAAMCFPEFTASRQADNNTRARARRKQVTHYRQMIARLNKRLGTVQINQCAKDWSSIDFGRQVTSCTLAKQRRAFLYVTKTGDIRGVDDDRIACAENLTTHIANCVSGQCSVKAKRCALDELVKAALDVVHMPASEEASLINLQWEEFVSSLPDLGNLVCVVDVSGSMTVDDGVPLRVAMGLGIAASSKSRLGERVLTFSSEPSWFDLSGYDTFVDKVNALRQAPWGGSTDFVKTLKLLSDACVQSDLPPEAVQATTLAVFSDMQIDCADRSCATMHERAETFFKNAGLRTSHCLPYPVPGMLYWNLRQTHGSPVAPDAGSAVLMSGFSPQILDNFFKGCHDTTPYTVMCQQLKNPRYEWVGDVVDSVLGSDNEFGPTKDASSSSVESTPTNSSPSATGSVSSETHEQSEPCRDMQASPKSAEEPVRVDPVEGESTSGGGSWWWPW